MQDKKSRGSKPSSVLGGHLSRPDGPAASSPQRLLSTFGLGEPPSLSAGSEIAAGRIALFTRLDRRQTPRRLGLCCSHAPVSACRSGLSALSPRRPGLTPGTPLYAARTFLWPRVGPATTLPHSLDVSILAPPEGKGAVVNEPPAPGARAERQCRRGDSNSHGLMPTTP